MSRDRTVWFRSITSLRLSCLAGSLYGKSSSLVSLRRYLYSIRNVPLVRCCPRQAYIYFTATAPHRVCCLDHVWGALVASSTMPTPSAFTLPEGSLILDRPEATASVQAWVKVTRHALCSRAPHPSVAAEIEVSAVSLTNGRLVFGFLVTPASFELAFSDHDLEEPTAGDADCIAFVDKRPIRCFPPAMSEPVGILVAARSILSSSTTSIKRSEYCSCAFTFSVFFASVRQWSVYTFSSCTSR